MNKNKLIEILLLATAAVLLGYALVGVSPLGATISAELLCPIEIDFPTESATIYCLWKGENGEWVAGGKNGVILTGRNGQRSTVFSGTSNDIRGIWGTAVDDLWAVGHNGVFLHNDGSGWSPVPLPDDYRYGEWNSVWGDSSGSIYIAGDNCELLRYDGHTLQPMSPVCGFDDFLAVWGDERGDLFVASERDRTWKFNGRSWSELEL